MDPWTFSSPDEDLQSKVFQALGGASGCWDNLSKAGMFLSDRCKQIGETLEAEIEKELAKRDDLLAYAWTIICNAGGGDWSRESGDFQYAAAKFREMYHATLPKRAEAAATLG